MCSAVRHRSRTLRGQWSRNIFEGFAFARHSQDEFDERGGEHKRRSKDIAVKKGARIVLFDQETEERWRPEAAHGGADRIEQRDR